MLLHCYQRKRQNLIFWLNSPTDWSCCYRLLPKRQLSTHNTMPPSSNWRKKSKAESQFWITSNAMLKDWETKSSKRKSESEKRNKGSPSKGTTKNWLLKPEPSMIHLLKKGKDSKISWITLSKPKQPISPGKTCYFCRESSKDMIAHPPPLWKQRTFTVKNSKRPASS